MHFITTVPPTLAHFATPLKFGEILSLSLVTHMQLYLKEAPSKLMQATPTDKAALIGVIFFGLWVALYARASQSDPDFLTKRTQMLTANSFSEYFSLRDVAGDGRCFYHAVVGQMDAGTTDQMLCDATADAINEAFSFCFEDDRCIQGEYTHQEMQEEKKRIRKIYIEKLEKLLTPEEGGRSSSMEEKLRDWLQRLKKSEGTFDRVDQEGLDILKRELSAICSGQLRELGSEPRDLIIKKDLEAEIEDLRNKKETALDLEVRFLSHHMEILELLLNTAEGFGGLKEEYTKKIQLIENSEIAQLRDELWGNGIVKSGTPILGEDFTRYINEVRNGKGYNGWGSNFRARYLAKRLGLTIHIVRPTRAFFNLSGLMALFFDVQLQSMRSSYGRIAHEFGEKHIYVYHSEGNHYQILQAKKGDLQETIQLIPV